MDNNFQPMFEDETYEPHYGMINSENQVQIYEMVMGDLNHEVTTVLERANFHLKDNRIPPPGFNSTHPVYDTVAIVGQALLDADFNYSGGLEGSGSDILHFHVPVSVNPVNLKVTARLHYQAVSSKWLEHMFSYVSYEIDVFKGYYESSDKQPVVMAADSLVSLYTGTHEDFPEDIRIYPNPASGTLIIDTEKEGIEEISIYNQMGQKVLTARPLDNTIDVSGLKNGAYVIECMINNIPVRQKLLIKK
jgi:hypothetical protein